MWCCQAYGLGLRPKGTLTTELEGLSVIPFKQKHAFSLIELPPSPSCRNLLWRRRRAHHHICYTIKTVSSSSFTNRPQFLSIFSKSSKPSQDQTNPNSLNLELNVSKKRFRDQTIGVWLHRLKTTSW